MKMTRRCARLLLIFSAVALPLVAQTELPSAPNPNVSMAAISEPVLASSSALSLPEIATTVASPTSSSNAHFYRVLPPTFASIGRDVAVVQAAPEAAMRPPSSGASRTYWVVTGALFAASAANAEMLARCPNCTFVPTSLHRRGFTYGAGLPVDVAVSYVSYKLEKHGHRWWFAPAVALTVANAYLSYHWASNSQ